jgi:uncharacterized protein (UPF0548 family)
MFSLTRPTDEQMESFLKSQREAPLSYSDEGATRAGRVPPGFRGDHHRLRIGWGPEAYAWACEALRRWVMFATGWTEVIPPAAAIEAGLVVAVAARHFGIWSTHPARIVYVLDEETETRRRYGFAYGTLPDHAMCGEERFLIELHVEDNSVWYDLVSFSRPRHPLLKVSYPIARSLQKRFAEESKQAMARAMAEPREDA